MDFLKKIFVFVIVCTPFVSACGETFTDLTGVLASPGNPRHYYPRNMECNWTISTPNNTKLFLTLLWYRVACDDKFEVTDLTNNTLIPSLSTLKCDVYHSGMFSVSNRIHLHFKTNQYNRIGGFRIAWKVQSNLIWYSDYVNMHEAEEICKQNGGMVAKNVNEYKDEILNIMKEHHQISIWHGKNVSPWVWTKGCYHFSSLDGFETFVTLKRNKMTECVKYCSGWNYFGLQGEKCFCIDTFAGSVVSTSSHCTKTCPGNTDRERCGGNNSLTIYMNDKCFTKSSLYQGTVSRTKNGNICLPWKDIEAIQRDTSTVFPDGSSLKASNYCRNPNGSETLWCYVSQSVTEFCDVPPCIDNGIKNSTSELCMATRKVSSDALRFEAWWCGYAHRAICSASDNQEYTNPKSMPWQNHRESFWYGWKCRNMAGPGVFSKQIRSKLDFHNYWIGYYRDFTSGTGLDLKENKRQCLTFFNEGDKIEEQATDCRSRKNFVCETVPITCGEIFDNFSNHSFSTHGYPTGYGALLHCVWTVMVPINHSLTLVINVDIEHSPFCQNDYLKIYFGTSTNGNPNSTVCGSTVKTINDTQTDITLEFQSDESNYSKGIMVEWTIEINTTTSSKQQGQQQDSTEYTLRLSDCVLAVVIVAAIVLLALACIGGVLFERRRRTYANKDAQKFNESDLNKRKDESSDANEDHINLLDSNYATISITTTVIEVSLPMKVRKDGGKLMNGKEVDFDTEASQAVYSIANKRKARIQQETNI